MPFCTSLLSSVLLVVSAVNSWVHSVWAASMSPVSSHSAVPVVLQVRQTSRLGNDSRSDRALGRRE